MLPGAAQSQGVGRRPISAWATHAVASGLKSAVVAVLAANPARAFYERLGARQLRDGICVLGGQPYLEIWYGWDNLDDLTGHHSF
jgi:hypothetical protein